MEMEFYSNFLKISTYSYTNPIRAVQKFDSTALYMKIIKSQSSNSYFFTYMFHLFHNLYGIIRMDYLMAWPSHFLSIKM